MGPIKLTAREKVPRLSDTYYLAKWGKIEMEIYKQQSEIVKRHLHAISVFGNVDGRQN